MEAAHQRGSRARVFLVLEPEHRCSGRCLGIDWGQTRHCELWQPGVQVQLRTRKAMVHLATCYMRKNAQVEVFQGPAQQQLALPALSNARQCAHGPG